MDRNRIGTGNRWLASLLAVCLPFSALGDTFHGYRCTVDCSGHEEGYRWARSRGIDDPAHCGGRSQSFIEGCQAWAEENGALALWPQPHDDDQDEGLDDGLDDLDGSDELWGTNEDENGWDADNDDAASDEDDDEASDRGSAA
jgi:hypothetical protein